MTDPISANLALASIFEEAAEVSAYLWEKGWAERNAGNLSVDVTEHLDGTEEGADIGPVRNLQGAYPNLSGRCFLVTGSGRRYRDLARDAARNACILRMEENGAGYRLIWGGGGAPGFGPTSEFPSHLRVHEFLRENKASEKAVLHTHPTELIALTHLPEYAEESALNRALWSMHPEVKITIPKGAGLTPYTLPGSEALARATVEAFGRDHPVVLWQMHGAVAIGTDVSEAFDRIDTLNKAAALILLCRGAGCDPKGLDSDQLNELVRAFGLKE